MVNQMVCGGIDKVLLLSCRRGESSMGSGIRFWWCLFSKTSFFINLLIVKVTSILIHALEKWKKA